MNALWASPEGGWFSGYLIGSGGLMLALGGVGYWLFQRYRGGDASDYDARGLRQKIGSECCEYSDGSGEVDSAKLARVCRSLNPRRLAGSLVRSEQADLANLLTTLHRIRRRLADNKRPVPRSLDGVIGAATAAARTALAERGASAGDLRVVTAAACCEYDDGSGDIYTAGINELFTGLDPEVFRDPFAEAPARDVCKLDALLKSLTSPGNARARQAIAGIRKLLAEVSAPAFEEAVRSLNRAEDASQLREVLVSTCCEYDDGSGDIYPQMDGLLQQLDLRAAKRALGQSSPGALHKLYTFLLQFARGGKAVPAAVHQLQAACCQALNARLHEITGAEELFHIVASVCSEYEDGSGKFYPGQAKVLLANLQVGRMADAIAASDVRWTWQLASMVEQVASASRLTADPGVAGLLTLLNRQIATKARTLCQALRETTNLRRIRSIISQAVKYDDCSGKVHVPTLQAILQGYYPPGPLARHGEPHEELVRAVGRLQERLQEKGDACQGLDVLEAALQGQPLPPRERPTESPSPAPARQDGRFVPHRVVVFREGNDPPADRQRYCMDLASQWCGRTVTRLDGAWCVGLKPGTALDLAYALGLYSRLIQLGKLADQGNYRDIFEGYDSDGCKVVALLF